MSGIQRSRGETGRLERAGPIGRIARIILGLFLAWYLIRFVAAWAGLVRQGDLASYRPVYTGVVQQWNVAFYALALLGVYLLPVGTRRARFIGAGIAFVVAMGLDYLLAGHWWGLPMAVFLSAIIIAFFGFFALSLIIAGVAGYLGCEETAIPNALLRRAQPEVHT